MQSELNKSKQLGEWFQEAAEKATDKYEKLLEENNKLKRTTQGDITTKLEKLLDKIGDCNLKLEEKIKKKLFPDYKVSFIKSCCVTYSYDV